MRRFLAVLALAFAITASAQLRPPLFTLRPVIGSVEDRFGNGLAVTRDRVLVAGFNEDYPGAASFYDLATGEPVATRISPEPSDNDGFGFRVAMSRRLAAVASGVPAVVRVYDGEQQLLGTIDGCGWTASLAMRGRRIAAVAECGIVVADWPTRQWTLDAPAGAGAIALDGHRVFVGASGGTGAPDHVIALDAMTGAVLWEATAPDGTPGDGFGASLAVVGSRILVGAPGDDADGSNTGAVYLIDGGTGRVRRRYPNPVRESDAGFGFSVAGGRRVVLVGAPYVNLRENGAGAGYLLDTRTGVLLDVLAPAPNEADANAGRAVAVTSTRLLVGGSDWSGIGLVGVWDR